MASPCARRRDSSEWNMPQAQPQQDQTSGRDRPVDPGQTSNATNVRCIEWQGRDPPCDMRTTHVPRQILEEHIRRSYRCLAQGCPDNVPDVSWISTANRKQHWRTLWHVMFLPHWCGITWTLPPGDALLFCPESQCDGCAAWCRRWPGHISPPALLTIAASETFLFNMAALRFLNPEKECEHEKEEGTEQQGAYRRQQTTSSSAPCCT